MVSIGWWGGRGGEETYDGNALGGRRGLVGVVEGAGERQ